MTVPNSNLGEWLWMKMELLEILHGLVLASSVESGRALTLTCILSISEPEEKRRETGQ